jgi:hypothetical protein
MKNGLEEDQDLFVGKIHYFIKLEKKRKMNLSERDCVTKERKKNSIK